MRRTATPPPWLPDGAPFEPDAWRLLLGEFDVQMATTPDPAGPGLQTVMRLYAEGAPPRVVGVDEDLDPDRTKVARWPVELRGETLYVGSSQAQDGPSEYDVQWASATGFCGEWRTRQPQWLREAQPGHPEFATGPFIARRRSASP